MFKKTPWFSGYQKPVRPGVYERKIPEVKSSVFSKWNGVCWFSCEFSIEDANDATEPSYFQHESWRGLATPPKTKCLLTVRMMPGMVYDDSTFGFYFKNQGPNTFTVTLHDVP